MNPKSMPLVPKPIEEIQRYVADSIKTLQAAGATDMLHLALSMAEYLKDAQRWAHVAENTVRWNNLEPRTSAEFRNWVDAEMESKRG